MMIGQLEELKRKREQFRVEIDMAAKSIVLHFDPMDADLVYVDKICPDRLKVYLAQIERVKKMYDRVSAEIKRLQAELGESEG
jgi:hypothetical protein